MTIRPRVALTALLAFLGLGACAKVAPPPGGAEDRDAPTIQLDGVLPAQGSGGVAPEAPVVIPFSERPDRRSVMRALTIWPTVDFRDVVWSADTLRLFPDPAWAADRNTLVRISRGAEDRRGNPLPSTFQLRFTTKSPPDSGEIVGRVWAGREGDADHPVQMLALDAADSLDFKTIVPHAIGEASRDGRYRLSGLDTSRDWRVAALIDRDDDLVPDGRGEAHAVAPDTLRFDAEATEVEVADFLVGTLDSMGTIDGEIAADSGAVVFATAHSLGAGADSSAALRSRPLTGGGLFSIKVPTGARYGVAAFVDADGDSLAGKDELRVEREEPISLRFTTKETGLRFNLSTPEEEESLEIEGSLLEGDAKGAAAEVDSAGTPSPPEGGAPE